MTTLTDNLSLKKPDKSQVDWDDELAFNWDTLDASIHANRVDRNVAVTGGGNLSWNASTGSLTFTADIIVETPVSVYKHIIPVSQSPLSMVLAGSSIYLDVDRNPSSDVTRTIGSGLSSNVPRGSIPLDDVSLALVVRGEDGSIYWANGFSMADGINNASFGAPPLDQNTIDALAGTSGTPDSANEFVTRDDPTNTNKRDPNAHTHADAANGGSSLSLEWGNVWTNAVHTHNSAAQGGQFDWGNVWNDAAHDHESAGQGGQFTWAAMLSNQDPSTFTHLAKTKDVIIPAAAFHNDPSGDKADLTTDGNYWFLSAGGGERIYAPVHLPVGVLITAITLYGKLTDVSNLISMVLYRSAMTDTAVNVAQASKTSFSGGVFNVSASLSHTVLSSTTYYLNLFMQRVSGGDDSVRVYGAKVDYQTVNLNQTQ